MDLRVDGKVAVVTGGSKGIGLAIGRRLLEGGAKVVLSSRKQEGLDAAAADLGGGDSVAVFAANAGHPQAPAETMAFALERFGAVDILVNNAAASVHYGPLMTIDARAADKTHEVNQRAVVLWARAAWEAWMQTHGGVVLNIASVGGFMVEPGIGYYNATKAAVLHLTRQLAAEMAPSVRVNAVAPGLVKTDLARALWEGERGERTAAATPLGRLGEPDDIAKATLFLCSDGAGWLTGQTLTVDGGQSLGATITH